MTQLINGVPVVLGRGDHLITVRVNGGTAQLQYSVDGIAMADLPDSAYSVDTDEIKSLSECSIQAVLTGGALVYTNLVSRN